MVGLGQLGSVGGRAVVSGIRGEGLVRQTLPCVVDSLTKLGNGTCRFGTNLWSQDWGGEAWSVSPYNSEQASGLEDEVRLLVALGKLGSVGGFASNSGHGGRA